MVGKLPHAAAAQPLGLEAGESACSMRQRLERAASRLQNRGESPVSASFSLRADQALVFERFAEYLISHARAAEPIPNSGFCRIVLPPRTGKTVLAGEIIGRCGLTATIVVPTRTLIQQTRRLLGEMLPRTPIGVLSGEERAVVADGINVTTYSMLQRLGAAAVPGPMRRSALVFVDEAHRAMTGSRTALLRDAFEPEALRIALTATPDYDAERRLCHFFPELIHEVSLGEALELGLLAPARIWVAEVDHAGSVVKMVAGDYQRDTLGRLMSAAPFFKATQLFRYAQGNKEKAALLCCSTRQQAYDLSKYLEAHRPLGAPTPALLLGGTPREERELALARFEAGEIDTLIQVGVLLEGWSSPRCKLLIDLAPSVSRVRATQKYFRAMTRSGTEEAHIYVLLPRDLPALPTLPTDLFGTPVGGYLAGTVLGEPEPSGGGQRALQQHLSTPVAGVRLRQRILLAAELKKPTLRRGDRAGVERVLATCPDFDPTKPPSRYRFRALLFRHRLFTGRGEALLEWLGFPADEAGYLRFLCVAEPDAVGARFLSGFEPGEHSVCEQTCGEDLEHLERAVARKARRSADRLAALESLRIFSGGNAPESPTPLDRILTTEYLSQPSRWMSSLPPRPLSVVERRFGLHGEAPRTLEQLGYEERVTREHVREIEAKALRQLRWYARRMPVEERAINEGRPIRPGHVHQLVVIRARPPPPSRRERRWAETALAALVQAAAPLSLTDLAAVLETDVLLAARAITVLVWQGQAAACCEGYIATESRRPSPDAPGPRGYAPGV